MIRRIVTFSVMTLAGLSLTNCPSAHSQAINLLIDPATNNDGAVLELVTAIKTVRASGVPGTINLFSNGLYTLTAPDNWEYGPNGLPQISGNITINGQGATIQRATNAPKFRFLYVSGGLSYETNTGDGLAAGTLSLNNLTLMGGLAKGGNAAGEAGGGAGMGGAIFNQGTLALVDVTLTANTARGGLGGAEHSGPGGGGGIGSDGETNGNGGGFGGPFIGRGGSGGAADLGGGGGGGGFGPNDNGTGTPYLPPPALWYAQNNGGGLGMLGGSLYGGSGDGGSGGEGYDDSNTGQVGNANGGDFGFGGFGLGDYSFTNTLDGGGGGVGGGGGHGGWLGNDGTGGFGGGGGGGGDYETGSGGFGGGGGCGNSAGMSVFAGGNGQGADTGGGGGGGLGGAIFNHRGLLFLTNCTITANTAHGGDSDSYFNAPLPYTPGGSGYGGGVFNLNGTVIIEGCMLSSNFSIPGYCYSLETNLAAAGDADGGALYNLAFGNKIEDGTASSATVMLDNTVLTNSSTGPIVIVTNGVLVTNTLTLNDLVNNEVDGIQTNTATVIFSTNSPAVVHIDFGQAQSITAATGSQAALLSAPAITADPIFQFNVIGVPGYHYVVQASTNMTDWVSLQTNVCPFVFEDTNSTNYPARYYRAYYQP